MSVAAVTNADIGYISNRVSQDGGTVPSFFAPDGGRYSLTKLDEDGEETETSPLHDDLLPDGGRTLSRHSNRSTDRKSFHSTHSEGPTQYDMQRKSIADIDVGEAEKWLNPYSTENRGIFASYLAVGFCIYFIVTPLTFYMVDNLNATPAQQSVVTGLLSLPWALKMICGFLSDSVPIYGYRRKPYFVIGWGIFVLCNVILAIIAEPNIAVLALFIFLSNMGFVLADVCTDAMIVERSKAFEHSGNRGSLQATGYIIRFFGGIVGATLGAVLYNKSSWGWGLPMWGIFMINALVPLVILLPFTWSLVEVKSEKPPRILAQINSIWELVQRKAVWKPCAFIYIYNMLLLTNPAWNSFLVNGLGFSNFDIGLLTLAGTVLSYFALVIYKRYLFNTSWRIIYLGATIFAFAFTSLQLILVFQLNRKIGMGAVGYELLFAMGSYGVTQFLTAIQFLPAVRMFLGMCPDGAEGASYAMLTTFSNLASVVAYSIAGAFAGVWDCSNETLSDHNYSGMWKLTLFCGCVQMGGLLFLWLLPSGVEEQMENQKHDSSSKFAGGVFVTVLGTSLSFVIAFTIISVLGG